MKIKRELASVCGCLFLAGSIGRGDPIPVPNYSFELPVTNNVPEWATTTVTTLSGSASLWVSGDTNGQALAMNVFMSSQGSARAIATSSNSLVTIAPSTTYTLTVALGHRGPSVADIYLLAGGNGVANYYHIGDNGVVNDYSCSFTTSATGDSRVGQPLTILLDLGTNLPGGGGAATFDNVRLDGTSTLPRLAIRALPPARVELRWSTNFTGYHLIGSSNLFASQWETITNQPTVQGNQFMVSIGTEGNSRYFRLQSP